MYVIVASYAYCICSVIIILCVCQCKKSSDYNVHSLVYVMVYVRKLC